MSHLDPGTELPEETGAATPMADAPTTPDEVVVRRNVVLSAVVGALAAALAVAFAVRALADGATLDWVGFAVLGAVTVLHAAAVVDGRAPLLVADSHGVRLRHGSRWEGIAWPEVECLEHLPRRLPFRDGHLLVIGYDGQQLIVPLTMASRVVGAEGSSLSDALAELADGRADVVEVVPDLKADDEAAIEADREAPAGDPGPPEDADAPEDTASTDEIPAVDDLPSDDDVAGDPPAPGRPTVLASRVEVQRPVHSTLRPQPGPHATHGANALSTNPEAAHTPDPELTVVLDDLAVHPAADPVIGPEIAAARQRLRLTVDQLSERTRIRPHVIEAIEVDDFGPCGGDFYARGHLRTLARVLGIEAAPLVASYDEKYADAPVDPRRVFQAELATGVGGAIRGTRGGRNWSVLIAAVMAAVLVWSVARLVMDGPVPVGDTPVLNQSGGISNGPQGKVAAVPVTLTAAGGGAKLVVRDAQGDIVFDGQLAFGQTSRLDVVPPVRIWSSDGSVTASVDGEPAEALGETGQEVTKTLVAP